MRRKRGSVVPSATVSVEMVEIRPPLWPSDLPPLYSRPLTRTKVKCGENEVPIRLASGLFITEPGDYELRLVMPDHGKFWVATSPDKDSDPRYAGGIRLLGKGLIPTPSMLANFGYTVGWLNENLPSNERYRRTNSRYRSFAFHGPEVFWTNQHGGIMTRLPGLGCAVQLVGVASVEDWERLADQLVVVLFGNAAHAKAFPGNPKVAPEQSKLRVVTEEAEPTAFSSVLVAPATFTVDVEELAVDELSTQLAVAEHLGDEQLAARTSQQLMAMTRGTPVRDDPKAIARTSPSADVLARFKAAGTANNKAGRKAVSKAETPTQPGEDISIETVLAKVKDAHYPDRDGQRRADFVPKLVAEGYGTAAVVAKCNYNDLARFLNGNQRRAQATIAAAQWLIDEAIKASVGESVADLTIQTSSAQT